MKKKKQIKINECINSYKMLQEKKATLKIYLIDVSNL